MYFTLSFQRTPAHYVELQQALTKADISESQVVRFLSGLSIPFAAGILGILAAVIIRDMPPPLWKYAASASLCGAAAAVIFLLFLRPANNNKARSEPDRNGSFLTGRQVTTSEEGIIEKGGGWQRAYTWASLIGMQKLPSGYLILHDTMDGIFIPFSAFSNNQHRFTFEEDMRTRLDS